jgi:hypothetical protein
MGTIYLSEELDSHGEALLNLLVSLLPPASRDAAHIAFSLPTIGVSLNRKDARFIFE